ncbi:MAG: phospho-N-acetylmuramoyl-pentapeptide-transferase [Bacillota bacterium]|nr:phospho-N-acetylmuramoyl-pentapeptide-transferase [Bacillota bacterium]
MHRVLYAGLLALAIVLGLGPVTIAYLRRLKFGQAVRTDGPQSHLKKSGIPTMGGLLLVAAFMVATVLVAPPGGRLSLALAATAGYFFVGLTDDLLIVVRRRPLGLKARHKLFWQCLFGFGVAYAVAVSPELGPRLSVPGWSGTIDLPVWAYTLFSGLVIMAGTANAVNLTDGLDGLAAGAVTIAAVAYALIALGRGAVDLAVFAGAVAGACLGFIWFNAPPAQVFMGDTGSLALGGALGSLALLTKAELWLALIGGLFVLETLSVTIQVVFFRLTGRRVFRMAPLHHHFELLGWPESKVVARFWLIALVFALAGLMLAPGRAVF